MPVGPSTVPWAHAPKQRNNPTRYSNLMRMYSFVATILLALGGYLQTATHSPHLDITEYLVSDTAKYASFHVKLINDDDSLTVIESIQPSCGCVLATVQRSLATAKKPGDIYVAVNTERMDTLQPVVIDVITNRNRNHPLQIAIRKETRTESRKK